MQLLQEKHFVLSSTALARLVQDTRARTLALVADLEEAQFEVPQLALVNPFRWELGHVTFFYEAFVCRGLGRPPPCSQGPRTCTTPSRSTTMIAGRCRSHRVSKPLPICSVSWTRRWNGSRDMPRARRRRISIYSLYYTRTCTVKR